MKQEKIHKPWITTGILRCLRNGNSLYKIGKETLMMKLLKSLIRDIETSAMLYYKNKGKYLTDSSLQGYTITIKNCGIW